MKKIIFHTNSSQTLFSFRLSLMEAVRDFGFEVVACGPRDEFSARIEARGIRFVDVPVTLAGRNPASELRTVFRLVCVYRRERPDAVHHFSLKPAIYGSAAGKLAGVPYVFNTVTGLGLAFCRPGFLQHVVKTLWRCCCRRGTWTTFQNADDFDLFRASRLIRPGRAVLIRGSGVNTRDFRAVRLPSQVSQGRSITFLMFGRMMWSKGVREYIEAAELFRNRIQERGSFIKVRFLLLGGARAGNPTEVKEEWLANPDTIPGEWLDAQAARGIVDYYPHDDNVIGYIERADVVVLPTYYREGVPRSLLEAMSCGRAIITTDAPGCRDVVQPGVNGFLVKPRNVESLARAFESIAMNGARLVAMGLASRNLVIQQFSDEVVVRDTLDLYLHAGLCQQTQGTALLGRTAERGV